MNQDDPNIEEQRLATPVKFNAGDAELTKMLECPVCYETITPPIILCNSGHAVCNYCRENLKSCPSCRGPFTTIRNRFAEDFLDKCLIQCKYRDAGCHVTLSGRELADHHNVCDYRPIVCQTCEQAIPYNKFLSHLRNEEKLETQKATECSTGFEIEDDELARAEVAERFSVWEPTWIHAYDRDFFCFLETSGGHWWIWVGIFGTAQDCNDYVCSITLWNKEKKTELKYIGKVHPVRTPREDVLKSGHCLLFLDVNLKNYLYKGGVDVLVRIDQEYVAPRTRKGSVVESPLAIFGKGKNGLSETGSRVNRLNRYYLGRHVPFNSTNTNNSEDTTSFAMADENVLDNTIYIE